MANPSKGGDAKLESLNPMRAWQSGAVFTVTLPAFAYGEYAKLMVAHRPRN